MDLLITQNSVNEISGIAKRKTIDNFKSKVIAITAEPMIIKGALKASLINIATASWSWFTSFVKRVINEDVPIISISLWDNELMCENKSFLKSVPKPWEALAAEYWHTNAQNSPKNPRTSKAIPALIT